MPRRIVSNFTRSLPVVLAGLTLLVLAPPLTRAQITPSADSSTNTADPTKNYGS